MDSDQMEQQLSTMGKQQQNDGSAILQSFLVSEKQYPDLCVPNSPHPLNAITCSAEQLDKSFLDPSFSEITPQEFLQGIQGKTLSFIGDSLTGQQFESLICWLAPLGAEKHEHEVEDGKQTYRRVTFPGDTHVQFHFIMGEEFDMSVRGNAPILAADWIVFNIGAHHKSMETLTRAIYKMVRFLRDNSQAQLIWREYSPTHFKEVLDFHGIVMEKQDGNGGCEPHSKDAVTMNNYSQMRLNVANDIISKNNIPILKVFEESDGAYDQHVAINSTNPQNQFVTDCRHWCYPSRVLDMWNNKLLRILRSA